MNKKDQSLYSVRYRIMAGFDVLIALDFEATCDDDDL